MVLIFEFVDFEVPAENPNKNELKISVRLVLGKISW